MRQAHKRPRELRKVVNAPGAPAGEKVYIRDTLEGIDKASTALSQRGPQRW